MPDSALEAKLESFRIDYREVTGESFKNFFCPIVFNDRPGELCKAHLVNQAFQGSSKKWTVQRADVDNFYGSAFESDFADLRHKGSSVESFFRDPSSMKRLRPRVYVNGRRLDYYVPKGVVPSAHSEVQMKGPDSTARLALKLQMSEMPTDQKVYLEVGIEKDCRMPALVAILKAAHLVVFEMLGYRYALSAGGLFLGHTILGKFFLANRGLSRPQILLNAESHFPEYSNLVRPILNPKQIIRDTVTDGLMYICGGLSPWAFLIFVRTSDSVQAALVPLLDTPDGAAQFVKFLRSTGGTIHARLCRFQEGVFHMSPNTETFLWPESNLR